jgi:hypothetical protein
MQHRIVRCSLRCVANPQEGYVEMRALLSGAAADRRDLKTVQRSFAAGKARSYCRECRNQRGLRLHDPTVAADLPDDRETLRALIAGYVRGRETGRRDGQASDEPLPLLAVPLRRQMPLLATQFPTA